MRYVALFSAVMVMAYVAGRHLVPASAIDAALQWTLGTMGLAITF